MPWKLQCFFVVVSQRHRRSRSVGFCAFALCIFILFSNQTSIEGGERMVVRNIKTNSSSIMALIIQDDQRSLSRKKWRGRRPIFSQSACAFSVSVLIERFWRTYSSWIENGGGTPNSYYLFFSLWIWKLKRKFIGAGPMGSSLVPLGQLVAWSADVVRTHSE